MRTKITRTNAPSETSPASGDFAFSNGDPYADKSEYVAKRLLFSIVSVEFEPERGYDGADRWAVTVEPDDNRGSEILTFGSNEKRDEQMKSAQAYIQRSGPIRSVRLKMVGKAYYFETVPVSRAS